ncbi:MAG: dihydroxyacetone kinase subunit L [Alkalibacterium sp.]|nr:dihydroxyacetone kinase subunit L [Alkalibacterium sp.]
MNLNADHLTRYLKTVVEKIEEEKNYLSELDRKLGDGDHGVTMSIGFNAVNKKLDELTDEKKVKTVLTSAGMSFLDAVGSSVGPLYASGFIKAGNALGDKEELTDEDIFSLWTSFVDGVEHRSGAKVGDKTILDTLIPFRESLKETSDSDGIVERFSKAVKAGKSGMEETENMQSNIGRSSRLGERSIGTKDPGATSAYLIIQTFLSYIESL